MIKKLVYPFVLLITLCAISTRIHAQGFGEEGDPGGDLPPVVVTPPPPPPPPPPDPEPTPPDPCTINPASCEPTYPVNPCVENPCSCSPACNASPPPPTGSTPPISIYGDHHLNAAKTPPQGTNAQIPGYCVYQTIANILAYYGITVNTGAIALKCMQLTNNSAEITGFVGTDQDLLNLVVSYLGTIPPPGPAPDNSIGQDIDAGDPVMAYIAVAGQTAFHEVMITGYNNNGTFVYFDPQSTLYVTAPAGTVFYDPIAINGAK